jgi:spermidine synthase
MKLFTETLSDGYGQSLSIDELLFEQQTEHQHLIIFQNRFFGRVMALDGIVQTTERDEFIYHEMMVHVPMLAHSAALRVLIIGGGDGGILREVLKHRSVEKVVQVEIDQAVIDLCKTFLPNHSAGAFDDPRVEIKIADGMAFVCEADIEPFDVIISDCTDPVGPGEVLFSSKFYEGCKRLLKSNGVFVAQNGVVFMQPDELINTQNRLSPYFKDTRFYTVAVPTYVGGVMALAWGCDDLQTSQLNVSLLHQRYEASGLNCRYYTPSVHASAFHLPAYVQNLIAK